MDQPVASSDRPSGAEDMARLIEDCDWGATTLGPKAAWPDRLRGLVDLMLGSRTMMCLMWGPEAHLLYNAPYAQSIDGAHPEALGRSAFEIWPQQRPIFEAPFARALAGDEAQMREQPLQLLRRDGSLIDVWFDATYTPVPGAAGAVAGVLVSLTDVTARVVASQQRDAAESLLRGSEERFRAIVETATDYAIFTTDPEGRIVEWPPGAQQVFGWSAEEAVGQLAEMTYTPEDREAEVPARERQQARDTGQAPNVRWHVCQNGSRVFIDGIMRPLLAADGTLTGFLKVGQDVTLQRATQERLKVLVAELQHRTRNLMTIVLSVLGRTHRDSTGQEDLAATLKSRYGALSRVNSLLSRLHEGDRVTFDELIRAELQAMGAVDGDGWGPQVILDGPAGVRLRSSTVQTLALALHELATNASKYGALAQREGRLALRWRRRVVNREPWLHVEWSETGIVVPDPEGAPQGTGFGRELIERALPHQLGAETTYVLATDGVRCTIDLPLSSKEGATNA